MMQEAIEERSRGRLDRQEVTPVLEWPMTRQTQAAVFVRGGTKANIIRSCLTLASNGSRSQRRITLLQGSRFRSLRVGPDTASHTWSSDVPTGPRSWYPAGGRQSTLARRTPQRPWL